MNKVFSYSKVAGYVAIILLILSLASIQSPLPTALSSCLWLLNPLLWVVFFVLLIQCSVKKSAIITPAAISLAAWILNVIQQVICIIANSTGWNSTFITINYVLIALFYIALIVGFIWLAKYFEKGSLQQISIILVPIVSAVLFIIHTIRFFLNCYATTPPAIEVLNTLLLSLPAIIFFFAFSKLKKS